MKILYGSAILPDLHFVVFIFRVSIYKTHLAQTLWYPNIVNFVSNALKPTFNSLHFLVRNLSLRTNELIEVLFIVGWQVCRIVLKWFVSHITLAIAETYFFFFISNYVRTTLKKSCVIQRVAKSKAISLHSGLDNKKHARLGSFPDRRDAPQQTSCLAMHGTTFWPKFCKGLFNYWIGLPFHYVLLVSHVIPLSF